MKNVNNKVSPALQQLMHTFDFQMFQYYILFYSLFPQGSLNFHLIQNTQGTLQNFLRANLHVELLSFKSNQGQVNILAGKTHRYTVYPHDSPPQWNLAVWEYVVLHVWGICLCVYVGSPSWNWLRSPIWCRRSPARCPLCLPNHAPLSLFLPVPAYVSGKHTLTHE